MWRSSCPAPPEGLSSSAWSPKYCGDFPFVQLRCDDSHAHRTVRLNVSDHRHHVGSKPLSRFPICSMSYLPDASGSNASAQPEVVLVSALGEPRYMHRSTRRSNSALVFSSSSRHTQAAPDSENKHLLHPPANANLGNPCSRDRGQAAAAAWNYGRSHNLPMKER